MNIYTDGQYLESNPDWHESHSDWKSAFVVKALEKHGITPRSVAEIGCGAGQILVELKAKLPADVVFTGYEISPQAFARASTKTAERLTYRNEDVLSADNPPHFDLALAIDVFEHVDDYIGFIRRIARIARYKAFHIPLELSVSSMLRPGTLAAARRDVGHIHYYTRETALATLRAAGLTVIEEHFTSIAIDRPTALKTKLLRLPRKAAAAAAPNLAARLFGGFSLFVLAE